MSKHFFKHVVNDNLVLQVEMGWDKPMRQFYCLIWSLQDEEIESESTAESPLYSNLDDIVLRQPLDYYLNVCLSYGIDIPNEMVIAILDDEERNAVNEVKVWN
ncbi:hypothetical protein DM819_05995 [Pseudomonas hunanensis]|uniref:Uncharacterized protein n=1 Tax=Pseudomonas hunanensis TaxID=1247546 RepID=A0ABD6MW24_9PSED|nr:hypothetical protein [Pseudomonas hunanensis]NWL45434.1 hypothetical protein [Pseudomonas hunanensis]